MKDFNVSPSSKEKSLFPQIYGIIIEYLMGFICGAMFSIYGYFVIEALKKNESKVVRKGTKHGVILSFLMVFVFAITFFSYAVYLKDINNQNLLLKKNSMNKKLLPLSFGSFFTRKWQLTAPVQRVRTKRRLLKKHLM